MIVALLAATVLLADVTPAATPAPDAAKAAPVAKTASSDARVCTSERMVGSRLPVRKCRTAAEAAAEKLQADRELAKMQGNNISVK